MKRKVIRIITLGIAAVLVLLSSSCNNAETADTEATAPVTNEISAESEAPNIATETITTEAITTAEETEKKEPNTNPCKASWLTADMKASLATVSRVDEKGALYEMDYTSDYYDTATTVILKKVASSLSAGCSAFSAYNASGDFMLCRNYDYKHKDAYGNYSGLNVIVRTAPAGKLKSIGICDACFLNTSTFNCGVLDNGKTDISYIALAPYACVDGMNEAGVTASLLVVDKKSGESVVNQNTGKERIIPSILLRYIMDNAHSVEEAVKLAQSYDIYTAGTSDLHMYVTDSGGVSAVFEWRKYGSDTKQELYVTYTNAVTNFYVGFDDAQDIYNSNGSVNEAYPRTQTTANNYKYGYGHGYLRFTTMVTALDKYIGTTDNGHGIRNSTVTEAQGFEILKSVAQNLGATYTSFTQFSAIYNLNKLTVSCYVHRNYDKLYTFSLK